MRTNKRTRSSRSRRRRTYLDPHYFSGFIHKRAHGPRNTRKARVSWVGYEITMAEVLQDLSYGRG